MVKGIFFRVNKNTDCILKDILKIVNAKNYSWKISDSDIYSKVTMENILVKGIYRGLDLLETLSKDYFVVFANFMAFSSVTEIDDIVTYDEFLNSKCEISLFVVDCDIYSIYVKDDYIFESIKEYLYKNNPLEIRIISEANADWYFGL